ncbi:MAG: hypothetical protein ABFC57_11675 [Veillonellales bacterium]
MGPLWWSLLIFHYQIAPGALSALLTKFHTVNHLTLLNIEYITSEEVIAVSFFNLNGFIMSALGALIGLLLIAILNDNDKENVLGNFIVGIGCILLIDASQQENQNKTKELNLADEVSKLKKKLAELELKIK